MIDVLRRTLVLAFCILSLDYARPLHAADEQLAADPQAQRRVQRLVMEFTRARRNEAKRLGLIQQAAQMGAPAPERLLEVLEKELAPQVRTYGERIAKLAAGFEQKRARTIDVEEVSRLRAAVLDLTKNQELTKEMIVETGDPAMKRLGEILLPDLQAISASSAALGRQRAALVAAGRMWEACAAVVALQTPAEEGAVADPPSFDSSSPLLADTDGAPREPSLLERAGVTDPPRAGASSSVIQPASSAPDAPMCMQCGVQMQRAGSCHACPSCGSTSGCS